MAAMPFRRRLVASSLAALALPSTRVGAQDRPFPNRPVRILVGSAPGGPSDFLARMFAEQVGPAFGQPFVVENRPGASGMPAADAVVKSPADGHVLLASGPASISVAPHLVPKLAYDPLRDLVPFGLLGAGAFVLVAHPSLEAGSVADLLRIVRASPGAVAYASGGNGSSGHLCTELFSSLTGTRMLHVPYKGDGQAVPDLLAGQVKVMFTAPNVGLPHVRSGRLRLLAVTTRERVASLPDAPTVHESGVPDFEYLGWIGMFAPAGTPVAVLDELAAASGRSLAQPAVRTRLDELAMTPPSRLADRRAIAEFIRTEHARLGRVIRDAGIVGNG